jgi:hypothetical protein
MTRDDLPNSHNATYIASLPPFSALAKLYTHIVIVICRGFSLDHFIALEISLSHVIVFIGSVHSRITLQLVHHPRHTCICFRLESRLISIIAFLT